MPVALRRAALLLFLLAAPAAGQNDQAFNAFYASFRAAVAQKDEAALRSVMAPGFGFIRGTNVAPDDVFKGLAADNGRQWANLQQAVAGQPTVYHGKQGRIFRILPCTPTDVIYNCVVIFSQDRQRPLALEGHDHAHAIRITRASVTLQLPAFSAIDSLVTHR